MTSYEIQTLVKQDSRNPPIEKNKNLKKTQIPSLHIVLKESPLQETVCTQILNNFKEKGKKIENLGNN